MKKFILWDLDGTLTDSRPGILRCFQYALERAGIPAPEETELLWVIGPPIHQSFAQLVPGASPAEVGELVAGYRERFSTLGLYENSIYQGIPELLNHLSGKSKFLATSKPHVFAGKILEHFALTGFFRGIYGSELDGRRSDKGELIAHILASESLDPAQTVIVGDRRHDILGAKKAGIASVGITWGYGSRAELETAGADHIFDSPVKLGEFLLP